MARNHDWRRGCSGGFLDSVVCGVVVCGCDTMKYCCRNCLNGLQRGIAIRCMAAITRERLRDTAPSIWAYYMPKYLNED